MTTQPRLVGGRYELGELIGYGGMAEVHRGRDIRLGRDVAIKVLRADLARDPSFLHRFRREAQAAAGLNHPSIVSVYDTGEDTGPDGVNQPYIVMEFVEGRTLRDILKSEGRLPVRRAMEVTADICGALDFSHRNGIIHRDIKPANVMITQSGAVKVMDFGIARAVADNAATVTQTANVIGTAQYLSPEQARGESVDARSDVYSTGCLLYELVTGAPPFQGDSPVAVAYQHVRENAMAPSARNPEVPPALDSIVMKALAKNQLNRYQSAGDMRTDLQRALANQPVVAEAVMTDADRTQFISRSPLPPVAVPRRDMDEPTEEEHHRRGGLVWLAIVAAMLLVIAGIVALVLATRNNDNGPKSVAIPAIIGLTADQAKTALHDNGFTNFELGPSISDLSKCADAGVQTNRVCLVTPPVGESTKTNAKITYQLYTQATTTIPSVVGLQYNDAAAKLTAAHLIPVEKTVDVPGNCQEAGCVTDQDPPPFGAPKAQNTKVTLSVWSGKVKLPDVRGKKLDAAQTSLNTAQFTNVDSSQTTVTHDQTKDNTVADENPKPNIAYPPDTKIQLTIYKFQPLAPTCTTVVPGTTPPPDTGLPTGGLPTGTTPPVLPPCPTP
jgi:beta-lactam-binding protein with PASTA domain/predicted Ser/Thr protein kinase